MKKIFILGLISIVFSFFIISCHCSKKSISSEVKRDFENEGYVKATVINYTIDGCTFMLQLSDEKKLEPVNLADEFKKDQLAVWIKYAPKKGAVSICMAGQVVTLSDIQIRK